MLYDEAANIYHSNILNVVIFLKLSERNISRLVCLDALFEISQGAYGILILVVRATELQVDVGFQELQTVSKSTQIFKFELTFSS